MTRRRAALLGLLFVTALSVDAHAQKKSVDACVGNFEEAQLKQKRGKLVAARELFASCADPRCPKLVRNDCASKRDEIDRVVPTATIVVRDAAGHDVDDAALAIDGEPFQGDRTRAFPIDPGAHVITYTLPGESPADEKVTIYEGEKARVVTIAAPPPKKAAPAPAPAARDGAHAVAAEGGGGRSVILPLVVGGAGVVLLATGIGLHITASNDQRAADEYAAKANDPSQAQDAATREEFLNASASRHDAAKNSELFAFVAGGAGLVAIGVAVVLYFVQPAKKKAASLRTRRAALAATPTLGGIVLHGTF